MPPHAQLRRESKASKAKEAEEAAAFNAKEPVHMEVGIATAAAVAPVPCRVPLRVPVAIHVRAAEAIGIQPHELIQVSRHPSPYICIFVSISFKVLLLFMTVSACLRAADCDDGKGSMENLAVAAAIAIEKEETVKAA